MCDCNSTGYEFYHIFECTHFVNDKKMFFSKRYYMLLIKFNELLNTYDVEQLKTLQKMLKEVLSVCSPIQPSVFQFAITFITYRCTCEFFAYMCA